MINLQHLSKIYNSPDGSIVTALDDINLHIPSGCIFGIIGASGAGKSTLIRCLNVLERPTHGHVLLEGCDLTALSMNKLNAARHQIGMIFQHFNLLQSRTVWGNIALPLELMHIPKAEQNERIQNLLELTGLTAKKNVYPSQLSGGQKQRVAIARALATQPKVLLCDEATSALDPHMTQSILNLLRDINKRLGLTIVLITHEMQVVKAICDHVAVIDQGKIIEQGRLIDFFLKPKTAVGQAFVDAALKVELAEAIRQRLAAQQHAMQRLPLWRLAFRGEAITEPLITHLVRELSVDINILQANIEHIREHMVGIMVVEAVGNDAQLAEGLTYLQTKGVHVEVMGYVN